MHTDHPHSKVYMPDIAQTEVDALGGFRLVASRYGGSPDGILRHVEGLETQVRTLTAERDTARGQVPKEGQTVIDAKKAKALEAFEALGTPEDLKTKLEKGDAAITGLAARDSRDAALSFVKAAGLHDETVDTIVALPTLQGAKFEVRQVEKDDGKGGKVKVPVAYLTLAGEGQKAMSFSDAQNEVPVLKGLRRADANNGGGTNNTVNSNNSASSGAPVVEFVAQSGGESGGNSSSVYDRIRAERAGGTTTGAASAAATTHPTVPPITELFGRLGMAGTAG